MSVAIARKVALEVLQRIEDADSYANLLLPRLLDKYKVDTRDSALAQELAFGTIRWKSTLEAIVLSAAGRKPGEIDADTMPVLILGAYQLLLTRVPIHAAINETVEQAKWVGNGKTSGLVNAVLRKVSAKKWNEWLDYVEKETKNSVQALALRHAHPEWIVTALKLALSSDGRADELETLLDADNEPAPINVVALPGLAVASDTANLEQHPSSPIGFVIDGGNPRELSAIKAGRLRVQDAGSQLVALALVAAEPVRQGEQWLDLCAGPGGKSVLLASEAALHQAVLTCNEPAPHRAKLVRDALTHSKLRAKVIQEDGRNIQGSYDRILVDAPCTGLGALRRRPEARWRKTPADLKTLNALQMELMNAAWKALKPGGTLVYSTCSPHPSETTSIVEQALRQFGTQAELIDATKILEEVSPTLRLTQGRKTVQLWPHRDDTDAMFIAVIRKSVS
jgi:16S rRNA (cytosine967-C5)-methyltransferase